MSRLITVHNTADEPIYDIVIEKDFSRLAEAVEKLGIKNRRICIITESHVGPLYADAVKAELEKTGNSIYVYTFEAGEANRTLIRYRMYMNSLYRISLTVRICLQLLVAA